MALAVGASGATIYVTGRSSKEGDSPLPGLVFATAADINAQGGVSIPVVCDHADDHATRQLFERVERDHGRLDLLVNSASAIPDALPFWRKPKLRRCGPAQSDVTTPVQDLCVLSTTLAIQLVRASAQVCSGNLRASVAQLAGDFRICGVHGVPVDDIAAHGWLNFRDIEAQQE